MEFKEINILYFILQYILEMTEKTAYPLIDLEKCCFYFSLLLNASLREWFSLFFSTG
jgi:hypothetical protein